MSAKRSIDRASAKWIASGAVGVLAIVAAVLVVLALQRVAGTDVSDQTPAPIPTFEATPTETTSPAPSPEPNPTATPPYDRSQERFLSVGNGVMWRGVAGRCSDIEPLLERSVDGGETWTDVTPRYLEIGSLSAVSTFAGAQGEIIASMGAGCETQALRTFTQGQFWESYPDVLAASQYVDPADAARIVTPDGPVAAPCADARSLRSAGGVTALVCEGVAYVLDADATWRPLSADGVNTLSASNRGIVVSHRTTSCVGLTITSFADATAASVEELGCQEVADVSAPTALAVTEDAVFVWSGDQIGRFLL